MRQIMGLDCNVEKFGARVVEVRAESSQACEECMDRPLDLGGCRRRKTNVILVEREHILQRARGPQREVDLLVHRRPSVHLRLPEPGQRRPERPDLGSPPLKLWERSPRAFWGGEHGQFEVPESIPHIVFLSTQRDAQRKWYNRSIIFQAFYIAPFCF